MFRILEPLLYSGARLMPGVQSDLGKLTDSQIEHLLKRETIEVVEAKPTKAKRTRRKREQT